MKFKKRKLIGKKVKVIRILSYFRLILRFFSEHHNKLKRKILNRPEMSLAFFVFVGLLVRLILAFNYDTGDTPATNIATGLFLQGKEVYGNPQIYFSPPPFSLHFLSLLHFVSNYLNIAYSGFWKLPPILSDVGITYLIYKISIKLYKQNKRSALYLATLYILNPISLFISGYHGQQEAFWIFLMMLSWYLIYFKKQFILPVLLTSIAIAYKLPAILLLPGLILSINGLKNKLLYLTFVAALFLVSLFPELYTSTRGLISQVFLYSSIQGVWGISSLFIKIFPIFTQYSKLISIPIELFMFIALFLYFINGVIKKNIDFIKFSLSILLIFFIFTPGFGSQYLLWPLPFLILFSKNLAKIYTVLVSFGLLHFYGLFFPPLDALLIFLQYNFYYKIRILYPFDLLIPVWLFMIYIVTNNFKLNLRKIIKYYKKKL